MAANGRISNGLIHEVSAVTRWYENKSVFITGATGFMGKVLVERLLTTCPGINKIYILLRKKKDVSPEKRLEELKQAPIFNHLKKHNSQRLEKLIAITGDIVLPELGISPEELQILTSSVNIVFHSAATVKFDEALRLSVTMNMLGTRRMLNIAKKMQKLEAMVHVSTAYCNCDRDVIDEVVYPPPGDMDRLLMCLEGMDDDILDEITPKLIGNRPNTYTFTKAMAEHIIAKEGTTLPICIVRPSIVTASYMNPLPGWVDNLNGPTGVLAGAGKGILRTMLVTRESTADIIPVDMCINAMIVAAWNIVKEKSSTIKVYNVTSGMSNPIKWKQLEAWGYQEMLNSPFEDVLWYPGGSFKNSRIVNAICVHLFHMIPAYVVDISSKIFGRKGPSMVRIQHKIQKAIQALQYFTTNEWTFLDNNVRHLYSKLSETDKKMYPFDIREVKWLPYLKDYVIGIRRYILKEEDQTLPAAKKHLIKMMIIHYITKGLVLFGIWRLLMANSNITKKFSYSVISFALLILRTLSTMFKSYL